MAEFRTLPTLLYRRKREWKRIPVTVGNLTDMEKIFYLVAL